MAEQTRTSVTFTYDTVNGNILQNVQDGDKIHFRAFGIIQHNGSINYDKTQILNSPGISPHIEYKGHSGTDIFINSNEHSGVASHDVHNYINIDYYLTVTKKDNAEYDFSDNIVFTRLDYGDIRYKGFKLELAKDEIDQLDDKNFIGDITDKKGKETQQLPYDRNVKVVEVKGRKEKSDDKKTRTNYLLVSKSTTAESGSTDPERPERQKRLEKIEKRKKESALYGIQPGNTETEKGTNSGSKNRTIKKR